MILVLSVSAEFFCATFDAKDAGGVEGYFNMQLGNGSASYRYSLDLSSFDAQGCNLSEGLNYHIHSYWTNTSTTSGANAYCGSSFTGGHFDPNLACSASSQNIGGLCVDIGRTSSSTPSYTYACSGKYDTGNYAYCEVGDLSGKFGLAKPSSDATTFEQTTNLVDYMPPYLANYGSADAMTYPWHSIVFHCKTGGTRLFCAKLVQGAPCDMTTTSENSDNDKEDAWAASGWNALAKLLVSLAVVVVLGAVGVGYVYYQRLQRSRPLAENEDGGLSAL